MQINASCKAIAQLLRETVWLLTKWINVTQEHPSTLHSCAFLPVPLHQRGKHLASLSGEKKIDSTTTGFCFHHALSFENKLEHWDYREHLAAVCSQHIILFHKYVQVAKTNSADILKFLYVFWDFLLPQKYDFNPKIICTFIIKIKRMQSSPHKTKFNSC